MVWSFVRLVGLLALEAPHRRSGVIQRRPSNRVRSESRFQDPLDGKITKHPPDCQFVILRDALIVAIESW